MDRIELRAYGKINTFLDITGRREDGYHYIRSFMQDIGIYDVLSIEIKNDKIKDNGCIVDNIALNFCTEQNTIPDGLDNLAVIGIKAYLEALTEDLGDIREQEKIHDLLFRLRNGCLEIHLTKNLPVAAGLAGGSGNAAAAMIGINELAGCPFDLKGLMDIGAGVGSDVPFSIMMNAAMNEDILKVRGNRSCAGIVEATGEKVTPAEPRKAHVLMVNPGIAVSTKDAYEALDREYSFGSGGSTVTDQKDVRSFYNIFEDYVINHYQEASELMKWMKDKLAADTVMMSGSGPTMIAMYSSRDAAEADYRRAAKECRERIGWRAWLTGTGGK